MDSFPALGLLWWLRDPEARAWWVIPRFHQRRRSARFCGVLSPIVGLIARRSASRAFDGQTAQPSMTRSPLHVCYEGPVRGHSWARIQHVQFHLACSACGPNDLTHVQACPLWCHALVPSGFPLVGKAPALEVLLSTSPALGRNLCSRLRGAPVLHVRFPARDRFHMLGVDQEQRTHLLQHIEDGAKDGCRYSPSPHGSRHGSSTSHPASTDQPSLSQRCARIGGVCHPDP